MAETSSGMDLNGNLGPSDAEKLKDIPIEDHDIDKAPKVSVSSGTSFRRERSASRDSSPPSERDIASDQLVIDTTFESTITTASSSSPATEDATVSSGGEDDTENSDPREEMILYNWQRQTMSVLNGSRIPETQRRIEEPLAQILCRATSILIRDDEVFASVALENSYDVRIYDFDSGREIGKLNSDLLSGSNRIILSHHKDRIYVAEFGGRIIFEIDRSYQLSGVARVKRPIGNFWVVLDDDLSFQCTYAHSRTGRPYTFFCTGGINLNCRLRYSGFSHCSVFGYHKESYYLISKDLREILAVTAKSSEIDCIESVGLELPEKICFPYSAGYCGELIYILSGDEIIVYRPKANVVTNIEGSKAADKVDEACRLIKRFKTL
ncbi:uncharacterized protein LOC100907593 [Galendromus occidentalis]|uniref:Uncharacterized protein LOC100907593 n=1 Tax=Galendromus occidentalis TaxID=34638 RepID=A0AAJ6QP76_9ACAR|nr:uncharacterized protein LOC100907593 [Galendromus occidentalis]